MLNGDVLTDIDLTAQLEQHERTGARATLALIGVDDPSAYGLVRCRDDGCVTEFLEKPGAEEVIDTNLVNAGAYILEREILAEMAPAGTNISIERDVFPKLVDHGLYGYEADGYWLDIGTPAATCRRPTTSSRARSTPRSGAQAQRRRDAAAARGRRRRAHRRAGGDRRGLSRSPTTPAIGGRVVLGRGVRIGGGCGRRGLGAARRRQRRRAHPHPRRDHRAAGVDDRRALPRSTAAWCSGTGCASGDDNALTAGARVFPGGRAFPTERSGFEQRTHTLT